MSASWTCPVCNRSFNKPNQSHSCVLVGLSFHFESKPPEIKKLYELIEKKMKGIGKFETSVTKSAILAATGKTFAAIKPRNNGVLVEFVLDREEKEFPIYKTFQISRNRVAHYVMVHEKDEVDGQLMRWLKEAFELSEKSKKDIRY